MQNTEKYYGFKIRLSDNITSESQTLLEAMARKYAIAEGLDLNEYSLFFHQLWIRDNDEHFGVSGGLSQRVNQLALEFKVNKKTGTKWSTSFREPLFDSRERIVCRKAISVGRSDAISYPCKIF